jgi:hypothetical protein
MYLTEFKPDCTFAGLLGALAREVQLCSTLAQAGDEAVSTLFNLALE